MCLRMHSEIYHQTFRWISVICIEVFRIILGNVRGQLGGSSIACNLLQRCILHAKSVVQQTAGIIIAGLLIEASYIYIWSSLTVTIGNWYLSFAVYYLTTVQITFCIKHCICTCFILIYIVWVHAFILLLFMGIMIRKE